MANMTQLWQQEAAAQAKKYSDAIKQQNQVYINQQNEAKNNALSALANQNQSAINQLESNKDTYRQSALDNAKQANINRLLALKSNQAAMNRAGLGTQGMVGTQVNSINNSYGTNLNSILRERDNALQGVDKQIGDTNLAYDTNRLNLTNQYDSNIANLQRSIDESALNQYNTIYQQYLAQKQAEWEREQAEKQRLEQIRQFNEQMAYQRQQDAIANQLKNINNKTIDNDPKFSGDPENDLENTQSNNNPVNMLKILSNVAKMTPKVGGAMSSVINRYGPQLAAKEAQAAISAGKSYNEILAIGKKYGIDFSQYLNK